jgi:hypothetical protein
MKNGCDGEPANKQRSIELPVIEDVDSLQLAYMSVAQRLAAKTLDAARGKVLLQTIQCAARNLEAYQSEE